MLKQQRQLCLCRWPILWLHHHFSNPCGICYATATYTSGLFHSCALCQSVDVFSCMCIILLAICYIRPSLHLSVFCMQEIFRSILDLQEMFLKKWFVGCVWIREWSTTCYWSFGVVIQQSLTHFLTCAFSSLCRKACKCINSNCYSYLQEWLDLVSYYCKSSQL